eukprot:TRINITY_DN16016_c0_g1_i20.p2 TRINITY_DN16016_c0_g1~~TRINITY_DN16016_c0_g1_i20.p2  ORF type:complete len:104 (+),score=27.34 TRINITY_DN16016_c0_g1_i20:412-723(+)
MTSKTLQRRQETATVPPVPPLSLLLTFTYLPLSLLLTFTYLTPQSPADFDLPAETANRILDAIQQQSERFQSLENTVELMREDISTIKTDVGLVRTRWEEIDR